SRDWSSDVCSSDLGPTYGEPSGQRFPGAFRFPPGAPRDKRPSRPHQTPRQHGTPSSAPRRPARPIIKLQAKPRVGAALTTEQPTRPTAPYVYEEGLEMAEIRGATFTHKLFHTRSFAWLWAVVRV